MNKAEPRQIKHLAIIGGGPAALMVYQRLIESSLRDFEVHIFEATDTLGQGMPYSPKGARREHSTNVSADELPKLIVPLDLWVKNLPDTTLKKYCIERDEFHEKKPLPRLLFGQYLSEQFDALLVQGKQKLFRTQLHCLTKVTDIQNGEDGVVVISEKGKSLSFDYAIICTGHYWPLRKEGKIPNYFDSPYPPPKIAKHFDAAVAIRGSSLTAVDAVRTLAQSNGVFEKEKTRLIFRANEDSPNFRITMYSQHGLLPCVRVHMEEPHTASDPALEQSEIDRNIADNNGFLELDFLFERGFKMPLRESDPEFYEQIKDLNLESFVEKMMEHRQDADPFTLLRKEYEEAAKSIDEEQPIYWKEALAALSFAMNYPAKHLSAEDMLRLRKVLLPLISVVIAFMPQRPCEELMALHAAGRLDLIADGGTGDIQVSEDNKIIYGYVEEDGQRKENEYGVFVNCTGQERLSLKEFPFQSLVEDGTLSGARLMFRDASKAEELIRAGKDEDIEKIDEIYYLRVIGADISDSFQVVDTRGSASEHIFLMAVPFMAGLNPDYSGLDFCEKASKLITDKIIAIKDAVSVLS